MANQIKDTNVIITPPVVIDPRHFLPSDLVGVQSGAGAPSQIDYGIDDADDSGAGDQVLLPPAWIKIYSEKVVIKGGKTTIDVVLECEDVEGAETYEVRLTKA